MKSLKELLEGLPENAQRFLIYKALFYDIPSILRLLGLAGHYHTNLRQENKQFKEAERTITEGSYFDEALILRYEMEQKDGSFILSSIIKQGKENIADMKPNEKNMLIQAVKTLEKMKKGTPEKWDLDHQILRRYTREESKHEGIR